VMVETHLKPELSKQPGPLYSVCVLHSVWLGARYFPLSSLIFFARTLIDILSFFGP
jgi:hypothetical protein